MDAPLGLRARNKLEKWRRIEAAAWQVFRAKGFDGATTREIASAAGVAQGTLFLYARDKAELVVRLWYGRIHETMDEAEGWLRWSEGDLEEDLNGIFATLFTMYEQDPELARVFVREVQFMAPAQRRQVDDQLHDFFGLLAKRVARAKAEGEVAAELAVPLVVQALFALYFSALTAWLAGWRTQEGALKEQLAPAIALLMRGVAPRESPPAGPILPPDPTSEGAA